MRRFRAKKREDPTAWKAYRAKETATMKVIKSWRSPEQQALERSRAVDNRRKRRQRQRDMGLQIGQSKKRKTSKADQDSMATGNRREKDKIRQRNYRAKLKAERPQKFVWNQIKEKQRKIKVALQRKSQQFPDGTTALRSVADDQNPSSGFRSSVTERKAVQRAKQSMPKSPKKFAAVVDGLTRIRSPRKKAAMKAKGIVPSAERQNEQLTADMEEGVKQFMKSTKSSRNIDQRRKRASLCRTVIKACKGRRSFSKLRKELGVSWEFLVRCSQTEDSDDFQQKQRKDALSEETKEKIQRYYTRGDVSSVDPSSAAVSVKTQEPTRYMEKTVAEAYTQFREETGVQISFSKFAAMRPNHMKAASKNKLRMCCCEYCSNVELKVQAINVFLKANGRQHLVLGSKYDVASATLCDKQESGFHAKTCIDRKCRDCGVHRLRQQLQEVLDDHADSILTWRAWVLQKETYQNSAGKNATSNRRVLATTTGPFKKVLCELEEELGTFALHLTNAQWQHVRFSALSANLPPTWLLLVMDYAENYTCHYQDEAQGAHWTPRQVTLHPIVAYYHCPEDNEIARETFVFVSSDLKHDAHAVQHFQVLCVKNLQQRGIEFTRIVHFTDGCGGQYKGKTSFVDCSFGMEDLGIPVEKHFFGSRHGKGPCDAEIGVIKRLSSLAVKRRHCRIATAEDLYQFGVAQLTKPNAAALHCHKRRSFYFVPTNVIDHERHGRTDDIKTLQGTRALHCVRGQSPYSVSYRERSCFCQACLDGVGHCENSNFCGAWKEQHLKINRRRRAGVRGGKIY